MGRCPLIRLPSRNGPSKHGNGGSLRPAPRTSSSGSKTGLHPERDEWCACVPSNGWSVCLRRPERTLPKNKDLLFARLLAEDAEAMQTKLNAVEGERLRQHTQATTAPALRPLLPLDDDAPIPAFRVTHHEPPPHHQPRFASRENRRRRTLRTTSPRPWPRPPTQTRPPLTRGPCRRMASAAPFPSTRASPPGRSGTTGAVWCRPPRCLLLLLLRLQRQPCRRRGKGRRAVVQGGGGRPQAGLQNV